MNTFHLILWGKHTLITNQIKNTEINEQTESSNTSEECIPVKQNLSQKCKDDSLFKSKEINGSGQQLREKRYKVVLARNTVDTISIHYKIHMLAKYKSEETSSVFKGNTFHRFMHEHMVCS